MKILHVSAYDIHGGAARATYRIHRSLLSHGKYCGLSSRLRVNVKSTDDHTVIGGTIPKSRLWRNLYPKIAQLSHRNFSTGNPVTHSVLWPDSGLGEELNLRYKHCGLDIVHLHWIDNATISVEEIGLLSMPLVWTLHDQWAFCGAEHYTSPPLHGESASSDVRFLLGYTPTSRPAHESGPDLNRRTWLRKRHAWRRPMHIICPSYWLAECARRSALMGSWPITVIPNPIDIKVWAPVDQSQARALLGLPPDLPLILFGADGGTVDPRKGADLLIAALQHLHNIVAGTLLDQLQLVVFGQSRPAQSPDVCFPIQYFGRLHDDISMRLLYSAADVLVIPSRQDNLPNTGLEAHACGTPVVAFRTGGLVDIVDHDVTGMLAEPYDPLSLAQSIRLVLVDQARRRRLGVAARQRAEQLWDPARVAGLYADVYQCAFELSRSV